MKKIYTYLSDFITLDFEWKSYLWTIILLFAALYFNYFSSLKGNYFTLEARLSIIYQYCYKSYLWYFFIYSIPFFLVLIPKIIISKDFYLLIQPKTIAFIFIGLAIVTLDGGYYFDTSIFETLPTNEKYIISRLVYDAHSFFTVLIPICIFYLLFKHKSKHKSTPFLYGITTKNFDWKPYFLMWLLMLPLIFIASFEKSFLIEYPKLKPADSLICFGLDSWIITILYELIYLLGFINVEIMMRGFMVIGLTKYLGRHAILPITMIYMLLHFEKPLAESIGSIFGGFILAVIAYRSQSILGGFFIHVGVAGAMELFAFLQIYLMFK